VKHISQALLALYEACLIGSLVACEVNVRELDLSADDFADVKARHLFMVVSELAEDAQLEYPGAFDLVAARVLADVARSQAVHSYLVDCYTDFVSRQTAITYADLIRREASARRSRLQVAARMRGRSA
jgi:hypothetical protein